LDDCVNPDRQIEAKHSKLFTARHAARFLLHGADLQAEAYGFDLFESFSAQLVSLKTSVPPESIAVSE
jgi:hypothetical protein